MRLHYALVLVATLLLLTSTASAQWTTQSPIPTDLDVRGVAAPTAQRVFIATEDDSFDEGGALFESNDGGSTWVQRDVPFSLGSGFYGLFFLDSQRGWAHGNENYRTLDGGTTWEELPFLGSTYHMEFFTPDFGYASTNGEQWISRNGGLDWVISPLGIRGYAFANSQLGLGVSALGLYRTTDGGLDFDQVHPDSAYAAAFLSETTAVAIADSTFLRSTDAGLTWTSVGFADGFNRIQVVTSEVLLAWRGGPFYPNDDGRLMRSTDGGQSWTDLGTVFEEGTGAFAVLGPQTVVAMDSRGALFRSTDAGLTWTQTYTSPGPRPSYLSSVRPVFPTPQDGYLAYGNGFVVRSTDGGASWSQISSGYGQSLNDIDRFPDGRLIAVGENGTVLTSDGTSPWQLRPALTARELVAIDVIDNQEVVVTDDDGLVYRSADGGATWTTTGQAPPLNEARDLHFQTLLDGWVVGSAGSNGSLWHTTDGGATWAPGLKPDGNPVIGLHVAVDFEGSNGWAAGSGDRYYRTTDGGTTWVQGNLPGSALSVRDLQFADASVGYTVGSRGVAMRSDDGGETWTSLPTPNTTDTFSDLYVLGPNELWISTFESKAYYSATGGQNWAVLDLEAEGFGSYSAIAATPEGDAWMVGFQGYIEHFMGPPPPPLNRPPVADYSFVAQGLTVAFTDESTDPDGTVVSWFWDFGDSTPDSTSAEQHPTHTFTEADTYHVRLTVTDDDGATATRLRFIAVQPGPGGTFGDFTEVTPLDPLFVTPQDEDFIVATTAAADYDGDGDLDIAVLGFYVVYNTSVEYRLVLLKNNGEATPTAWDFDYIDVPIGDLSTGSSDMAWADADGDGDQDLLVGSDGETRLYRNDDGTLVETATVLPGYAEDNLQADFDLRSITWADYDNDGDADLLLPSIYDDEHFAYRTKLMRNEGPDGNGGWTFVEADSVFAPTDHAQSDWADIDGDNDLDLLLVHLAPLTDNGFIRLYRNEGGGAFLGEDLLGALTVEHGEAQWGDYDADGDYDLLIAGHIKETDGTYDNVLRIYRNDAGTYSPFEVIDCPQCEGWFDLSAGTWADYDSDGDMDILLAGTYNSGSQIEGRAMIYTNDGTGTFTTTGDQLPAPRSSGSRGGTFSWLDMDGDGDLDYFIAGEYFVPGGNGLVETQMHLYRNDVATTNAAPSAPSGLTVTLSPPSPLQDGRTATLSWNPAQDDSTPAAALTYELMLWNGDVPTMPHRLPEPGTLSAVTDWVIHDLADGDYTWTVRAVDSAYNGGALAEGTFTVGSTTGTAPEGLPLVYALEAAYPNPFQRSTTIRYALPEGADVDLAVYDVLGRLVTRLVQDERSAGFHSVEWSGDSVASGTYLVRLSTEAFTDTQQVVLVK